MSENPAMLKVDDFSDLQDLYCRELVFMFELLELGSTARLQQFRILCGEDGKRTANKNYFKEAHE